jgi:hypothetical protein
MEAILSWIKLPKNLAWPLAIVSGLLIWGPEKFITGLGLQQFIDIYRDWIGIVFLFLLILGLQPLAPFVYEITIDKYRESKRQDAAINSAQEAQEKAERNIRSLTNYENFSGIVNLAT